MEGQKYSLQTESTHLQSSELLWNTFPLIDCLDCPIVSILTNIQALPAKRLTGVTQVHSGIIFLEQSYFLRKCDITVPNLITSSFLQVLPT